MQLEFWKTVAKQTVWRGVGKNEVNLFSYSCEDGEKTESFIKTRKDFVTYFHNDAKRDVEL